MCRGIADKQEPPRRVRSCRRSNCKETLVAHRTSLAADRASASTVLRGRGHPRLDEHQLGQAEDFLHRDHSAREPTPGRHLLGRRGQARNPIGKAWGALAKGLWHGPVIGVGVLIPISLRPNTPSHTRVWRIGRGQLGPASPRQQRCNGTPANGQTRRTPASGGVSSDQATSSQCKTAILVPAQSRSKMVVPLIGRLLLGSGAAHQHPVSSDP